MNNYVENFRSKAEEIEFSSFEELLSFAKDNAFIYDGISHTLCEPTLVNISDCPNPVQCGNCYTCDYFIDALTDDDAIFNYTPLSIVCVYPNKHR